MASSVGPPDVRLAEIVAAVSLATDLACGAPLEEGLRRTLLVLWLDEELGLDASTLRDSYYVALLGALGCTIEVALFERPIRQQVADGGAMAGAFETAGYLLGKAAASHPNARAALPAVDIFSESRIMCWDVSKQLGEMLDISPTVREALGQAHEHWDGGGAPLGLKGDEISLAARLFNVAHWAEKAGRVGGVDAATTNVRERAGRVSDPASRPCSREEWERVKRHPSPARSQAKTHHHLS